MSPDLEKRVPREILEELIEEGTEAFRGILEKLFNVAMQLGRSEFLGAEAYERTKSRRGYRNGFKGKRIRTRVGELRLEIPQVRGLRFYPKSLERGCRSEKALKLAIAEMYVMGVSTRKVTEITEQLCGLEISATQVSRVAGMLDEELEEFRSRELGEYPIVYLDAHYEKVRRGGRVQDVAILKAVAVNRFGTREGLGLSAKISDGCSVSVLSLLFVFRTVLMLSSSSRASSAVSTGVFPFLTTYFGPRTAWAGFTSRTWPVTSQSKSMRSAARDCLTVGGENSPWRSFTKAATWKGCTSASWRMPCASHHSAKRRVAFRYALRVWPLLIWAVKNSRTRFAALGVGANSGAG